MFNFSHNFQVFDILPLYGTLQPGDTEQVTMTFYGHADVWGQAKAICEVTGGPTYEISLKGEASLVSYNFDCKEIDYGKQVIKKEHFLYWIYFIFLACDKCHSSSTNGKSLCGKAASCLERLVLITGARKPGNMGR